MANTPDLAPTRKRTASGGSTASSAASTAEAAAEAAAASVAEDAREAELQAQVSQLHADLKAIAATLTKLTGEKVEEVREVAKGEMRHLRHKGQNVLDEAQSQAGAMEKQLTDTIREKPLTAVASAMGIGFILALLTRH